MSDSSYPSKKLIPWPAAPILNATIVLATTHDRLAGGAGALTSAQLNDGEIARLSSLEFVWFKNDVAGATNGIRVYAMGSAGVWREVDVKDDNALSTIGAAAPQTVGVIAANQERRWMLDCSRYWGVAVEYTAQGAPTVWDGNIIAHLAVEALSR